MERFPGACIFLSLCLLTWWQTSVRFAFTSARLDWDKDWKAQDDKKIVKAINVVLADFPEAKRFENAWAIKRIAHEAFANRRSYGRCVDDPNTYRGRKTLERRRRGSEAPLTSPSRNCESPLTTPSRTPSPHPSTIPRRRTRIDSDDDEDDDLANLLDGDGEPAAKRVHCE